MVLTLAAKDTVLLRDALVVRLPARAGDALPPLATLQFSFVRIVRDKAVQSGRATLAELPMAAQIVLLMPSEDVLLLERTVPPLSERKMRAALPALIEDATLADIATLHVAASPQKSGKRLLAVVDRALMSQWLSLFRQAERRVVSIWCESLVMPYGGAAWSFALRRDPATPGAILRTARDTVIALSGDPLVDEALLNHIASQGTNQAEVLLFGEPAALSGYEPLFKQFGFVTTQGGRDPLLAYLERRHDDGPLDLMQGEFGGSGFTLASVRSWQGVALLVVAALVIETVGLSIRVSQLNDDKRELIAEESETLKRAFPETTTVLDAPAQMRRALSGLEARRGQSTAGDFETLLGDAGTLLAALPPNAATEMHFESGALTLHLKAPFLSDGPSQSTLTRTAPTLGASATIVPASGDGGITLRLQPKALP